MENTVHARQRPICLPILHFVVGVSLRVQYCSLTVSDGLCSVTVSEQFITQIILMCDLFRGVIGTELTIVVLVCLVFLYIHIIVTSCYLARSRHIC